MHQTVSDLANQVADESDADVIVYNGDLDGPIDRKLIRACIDRRRRPNVILILVTFGGDADVAYRLARCLQIKYDRFSLYITGDCKSAGTLVAVGAHELIFSDHGELGPLDVQILKKDELFQTQSGLTVTAALTALQSKAYLAFEEFLLETERRSGGHIGFKTAAETATNLTIGLFAPLYSQLDPFHIGEAARALQIADQYGRRLLSHSQNMEIPSLHHIITHYPSHAFVIDREEAQELFNNVREPTPSEVMLAERLGDAAHYHGSHHDLTFLSDETPREDEPQNAIEPKIEVAAAEEVDSRREPDQPLEEPGSQPKKVHTARRPPTETIAGQPQRN